MNKRFLMRLVVALFSAVFLSVFWLLVIYPNQKNDGSGKSVQINLQDLRDYEQVSQKLEKEGLIESSFLWRKFASITHPSPNFRKGDLLMNDQLSPRQILSKVVHGLGLADVKVTIPEGYNLFDIANLLETKGICSASEFREITKDEVFLSKHKIPGSNAEGYLFPDTYWLREESQCKDVASHLIETWKRKTQTLFTIENEGFRKITTELKWDVHQIMTLASIVEKEAAVASERATIAGVFINRMNSKTFKPKLLQADPTVAYGCLVQEQQAISCVGFEGSVTVSMLKDKTNIYNTYKNTGLPPGPISNPGLASINAVLNYEKHNYFYFVVKEKGEHSFSASLEEHKKAVKQFRENL